jgi:hypothetical protein
MQPEGEVQSNPAKLEWTVEQSINARTFRRVQNLRVQLIAGQIVVHGSAGSYYVKLLALEAAREVLASIGPIPLLVDIQIISLQI